MLKKTLFILGMAGLSFLGIGFPCSANASTSVVWNKENVSELEKLLVCCEMADQKIMDLGTALNLMRNGDLSITKINTGVYHVVYPGGGLIIILQAED